jgi:hypothetical protein
LALNDTITIGGITSPVEVNGTWTIGFKDTNYIYIDVGVLLGPMSPPPTFTGTATITANVAVADHSPRTHPSEWTRDYFVLPNAELAVFMNNRLYVPTAYTPGADGYASGGTYTKADFIVVTDVLDPVHFFFPNEFRINQGSADEIVDLVKYSADTAIVLKGTTWGVLSGLNGDVATSATLDMRGEQYGACASRSGVVAGKNMLFPSMKRGICGLQQNDLGQTRSVDTPFSNDLEGTIQRINWQAAGCIKLAWWDDKLYAAVPLDGAAENNAILVYDFRRTVRGGLLTFDFQSGAWDGVDEGPALCVQEFFEAVHQGKRRLCFLGTDGWVSIVEECWEGDQVGDATQPGGVRTVPLQTEVLTRGYAFAGPDQKRWKQAELVAGVWNAQLGVSALTGASGSERVLLPPTEWSRTRYLKPAGKADFVEGNANGDWAEPGRGDYSVRLITAGLKMDLEAGRWQELTVRRSMRAMAGRWGQLRVECWRGRIRLMGIGPVKSDGGRRAGVMVG